MTYHRVNVESETARSFQIVVGLQVGFGDNNPVHDTAAAGTVVSRVIETRINSGLPFLSGLLSESTLLYGIGRQGAAQARQEPAAVFSGTVSVRRTPVPTDDEAIAMIEELAVSLGSALGQTRVNVEYCGRAWVLEADEASLPDEPHRKPVRRWCD